ncbi:MAG: CBS domain-containing protein [Candidatus Promineifilaceae bacterium]|nr:CBS domain-containing protein [Candidatus Promineifilaceae bacterium]
MTLKEVLRTDEVVHLNLRNYCHVSPGTTVRDAVDCMRGKKAAVCVVVEDERPIGILSDRDVLRKVAAHPESWERPIEDYMTRNPVTISLDATAADALWLMDEKGVRNLPAVDKDGKLAGNMTYQSIINYLAGRYPTEILNLPPRPDQYPDQAEGG